MTNTLHNIVVYIKDWAMLQEAREILERYGESMMFICFFFSPRNVKWNYLQIYIDKWGLYDLKENQKEITLSELEQLLKHKIDE